jgi:hypothetical protein
LTSMNTDPACADRRRIDGTDLIRNSSATYRPRL